MSLINFLIIDGVFLIISLPLIWIIKENQNNNKISDEKSLNLLSLNELLELEKIAKKEGSGIDFNSLIGIWNFISVWKQGNKNKDNLSSSLLRLFSANLELKQKQINKKDSYFDICNSIQFGDLSIKFIGNGELKGAQPILYFVFERIELRLSNKVLFSRSLEIPDKNRRPFFSLIALKSNNSLLSARGRGGGLALWLKD